MSPSRQPLDTARDVWQALSPERRNEIQTSIKARDRADLVRAVGNEVLVRLEREEAELAGMSSRTSLGGRALRQLAERLAALLVGDGSAGGFEQAYALQLLALALPLTGFRDDLSGIDGRGADEIVELIRRAHDHEALPALARHRAVHWLASEVMRAGGPELRAKAVEVSTRSLQAPKAATWHARPDRLLLSVDHTSLSCARYLAGLEAPERDDYGFDELRSGPGGKAKRVDQVTVKYDPAGSGASAEANGQAPIDLARGSELKAKLFVALIALMADARAAGGAESVSVRLRVLLEMMGYQLGRVTNSRYYWRYAAELTRYLLLDLPNRVVAMQVSYPTGREPLIVFEPLLTMCRPLSGSGTPLDAAEVARLRSAAALAAAGGTDDATVREVRNSGLEGFEFAVSADLMEALGTGKPLNAIEQVPVELLALKGPAFWLAWQVAFLRRWAPPPTSGALGKPLLKVLDEAGYLAGNSRGGRVRYRDALGEWWRDVGRLVEMELLDEPGVRLYALKGGAWREVSSELSKSLDKGTGRLSRARLGEVRVLFEVPRWRAAQLADARRRARRRGSGGTGAR